MNQRRIWSVALLVFAFASPSLFAQILQIRAYSTSDGLPQSEIVSIYQDRAGYIWLGTYENGLTRYDGRTFQRFAGPAGLKTGAIRAIFQDRHGAVWVGTETGLVRFPLSPGAEDAALEVYTTDNGLPSNTVTSVLEDSSGALWVGTFSGACRRMNDTLFAPKLTPNPTDNNAILSMAVATDGSVWMGTRAGVNVWRGDSVHTLTTAEGLGSNFVRSVFCDRNGVMWIGTSAGLSCLHNAVVQTFNENDGLQDVNITALTQDHQGLLWIGALSGLSQFDPNLINSSNGQSIANNHSKNNRFRHFDHRHGLSIDRIASLFVDYENNLWAGTWGGGVNKLKLFANYIENYTPRNGLPAASVYSFLEDRRHRIWIGTNGGGLAILDGDSLVIIDVRHGLPNNVVYTLAIDSSQAIWIGTEAGVVRIPSPARMPQLLDKKQWQIFTTKNGLPNDRIRNIYCTPQGEVWLGTYGGGAVRYFEKQLTVLAEKEGMQNTFVQALLQDRQGRLWIATNGGLFCRSAAGQKVSRITENLPLEEIYCIFEDHAGDLWFGTRRGGAACYLDGKFLIWNMENGLSDNVVYFIAEDREHRLWLGTNAGVHCFNAETVKAFKQNQSAQMTEIKSRPDSLQKALPLFNLVAVHGLADNECNTRATLCDRDGSLWFGTASGATRLHPNLLPPVTPSPRVHIQSMEVDGSAWFIRDSLELPARAKTSLTFHFATLSFIDEKYARSEYYLEGFDDDWTDAVAENHARYTNLSPGSYKFHLRGVNAFGVPSQATTQIHFTILPLFYRTWWFIAGSIFFVAGLAYGGHRWRVRHVHRRNAVLEKAVEEKTHRLQETLDFVSNIKDSLPVGLLVVDNKRFVVEANQTSTELFDYELKDLIGHELHNLLTSDKMTRDMIWAALREEMHSSTSAFSSNGKLKTVAGQTGIELEGLRRRDGKKFPCLVHACSVENEHGELRYVIVTCEDIAEWRQLEQNFIENQKQLALVDLMAGMGDILNNKLAGIQGYLDLMKTALTVGVARREDSGHNTPVNPIEVVNWAQTSAGEMSMILRQLIEFGAYLAKVPIVPLDLREILQALEQRWNKILKVKIPDMPAPIPIKTIPKIKAGLNEAIRNSHEAAADEVLIHVETLADQSRVRLTLTDNGRGVSPELVTKVFLPFFKTKATSHPGLGLWKLRQIVQQSGGTVEINFVPKGGTQLVVMLPMATLDQLVNHAGSQTATAEPAI